MPTPVPMMYQNADTKVRKGSGGDVQKKRKSAMGYSGVTKSYNR